MNIGVVIVFHSNLEELTETIDSIPVGWARIILCDASAGGQAMHIGEVRADATWVDCSRNGGYAWAMNKGVEFLLSGDLAIDVIVISNPDVIYTVEALDSLASSVTAAPGLYFPIQEDSAGRTLSHSVLRGMSRIGMLTGWILPSSSRYSGANMRFREMAELENACVRIPRSMAGSGACIAVDPGTWSVLNGFNSKFFLFGEDRSLSFQAHSMGLPLYLAGNVRVRHDGGFKRRGMTLFQLLEYVASERIAWATFWDTPIYFLIMAQAMGVFLRFARSALVGNSRMAKIYLRLWMIIISERIEHEVLVGADGIRVSATSALGIEAS